MSQHINLRPIILVNFALVTAIMFSVSTLLDRNVSGEVEAPNMGNVEAPVGSLPEPPAGALKAALAALCPQLPALHQKSSLAAVSAQSAIVQSMVQKYQLTPQDPQSFNGVYTLADISESGLNPGPLISRNPANTQYMVVVSHGSWPATLRGGTDESAKFSAANPVTVIWKYRLIDLQTGKLVAGLQLPENAKNCTSALKT